MRIGVVIRTKDKYWAVTRFGDSEAAQKFMDLVERKLSDIIKDINIIQLDVKNPIRPGIDFYPSPENFRAHRYWCPWCGEVRQFCKTSEYGDILVCPVCHISDAEFYVRAFNRLDFYVEEKKERRKKEKKHEQKV